MTDDPAFAPFLDLWGLTRDGTPAQGRQIIYVRRGDERLALKLLPAGTDEERSARVLSHWRGEGAVRVVESAAGAVLMERAMPGEELTGLVTGGRDDDATRILCRTMRRLDRPPPSVLDGFPTIAKWGLGFERNRAGTLRLGMDGALIDQGKAVFFDLAASQAEPILLHGDLHHANLVRDESRGWLAIDPKGVLGEAVYETGSLLRNPLVDRDLFMRTEIIDRRARIIAEERGHDYRRIIGWCFAQWVLSALWGVEDGNYEAGWLRGAYATQPLLAL